MLAEHDGLLVFERPRPAPVIVEVRLLESGTAAIAETRTIEVRVTSAAPGERHVFRARPISEGVHLVDGDVLETRGREPARLRFTSDRPGRAAVSIQRTDP